MSCREIVEEEINNDDHFSSDAQASIVLADYKTGQIKAIAGGRGEKTASLVLNRATDSIRQPGSTFKIPGGICGRSGAGYDYTGDNDR